MGAVTRAVERIRAIPGAFVDANYAQGREAVIANLVRYGLKDQITWITSNFDGYRTSIKEFQDWVSPYQLPPDYLFFLEYYAGLKIETNSVYFSIEGGGPMQFNWYRYLTVWADFEPRKDGLLEIAFLKFQGNDDYFAFTIDLAGLLQTNSVIRYINESRTVLADSFTQFLNLVADTGGSLEQLLR